MSELDEPRVRCPTCGKLAPAMKYCIYCGTKLQPTAPPTVEPPQPRPSIPPPVPPTTAPPTAPAAPRPAPQPALAKVTDEVASLMSDITALYDRKVALLDMFESGEVSEKVFLKLYNEYSNKLSDSLRARTIMTEQMKGKLSDRNNRLSEVGMRLEELGVRQKIGEIDANAYSQRTENLKAEERELADSVKTLRTDIVRLEKILAEKKPSEIRDLEANLRTHHSAFQKLLDEEKISAETFNTVKPSIEETLKFLESLISKRKEKEKNLREQLETLQTRYKLSELSIEEYERRKRELQAELDKIWA